MGRYKVLPADTVAMATTVVTGIIRRGRPVGAVAMA